MKFSVIENPGTPASVTNVYEAESPQNALWQHSQTLETVSLQVSEVRMLAANPYGVIAFYSIIGRSEHPTPLILEVKALPR